mmetsp:Transcript_23482/g.66763  ORF Transcript_23482/g.66763 Transcript_23482/m.66763 type:complete len:343 (-) Transcript_23482:159-1187(-)
MTVELLREGLQPPHQVGLQGPWQPPARQLAPPRAHVARQGQEVAARNHCEALALEGHDGAHRLQRGAAAAGLADGVPKQLAVAAVGDAVGGLLFGVPQLQLPLRRQRGAHASRDHAGYVHPVDSVERLLEREDAEGLPRVVVRRPVLSVAEGLYHLLLPPLKDLLAHIPDALLARILAAWMARGAIAATCRNTMPEHARVEVLEHVGELLQGGLLIGNQENLEAQPVVHAHALDGPLHGLRDPRRAVPEQTAADGSQVDAERPMGALVADGGKHCRPQRRLVGGLQREARQGLPEGGLVAGLGHRAHRGKDLRHELLWVSEQAATPVVAGDLNVLVHTHAQP